MPVPDIRTKPTISSILATLLDRHDPVALATARTIPPCRSYLSKLDFIAAALGSVQVDLEEVASLLEHSRKKVDSSEYSALVSNLRGAASTHAASKLAGSFKAGLHNPRKFVCRDLDGTSILFSEDKVVIRDQDVFLILLLMYLEARGPSKGSVSQVVCWTKVSVRSLSTSFGISRDCAFHELKATQCSRLRPTATVFLQRLLSAI